MALGLTQPLTEIPGGKDGWCIWLTTLAPSCADRVEIWEPQPPGTLMAVQACNGIALLYTSCQAFHCDTGQCSVNEILSPQLIYMSFLM
jgi:hypothetical protein